MKLNKKDKELYGDCGGRCSACSYDGGCSLQIKIKNAKKAKKSKKAKKQNG